MTYAVAKDITDFLIKNSEQAGIIPAINFFGGEPLLLWDTVIVPLVRYIREEYGQPFQLSMTSNCVAINKEKLEFMKHYSIGLLFSIDGDKETQDYNRPLKSGNSSFDLLSDKIPLILKYYPEMTFRATLIPRTCHNLFHNIQFAERMGYHSYFTMPNVFEAWDDAARKIVEEQLRLYSDYCIASYRSNIQPILFGPYTITFPKIQRINTAIVNNECRRDDIYGACAKCGLGSQTFAAIDFQGNVYACQELVSPTGENDIFYIGSIYTGVRDDLRKKLSCSFNTESEHGVNCKSCRINRVCDGGCVANNYMSTGNINIMPEAFCWWQKLLLEEVIRITKIMGEEQNPLFMDFWKRALDGGYYG